MARIVFLLFILSLTGCAGLPFTSYEVKVPVVAECPEPPYVQRPVLPIMTLTSTEPADVAKAYKISIKMLQKWGLTLEQYLEGYRKDVSTEFRTIN